MKHFSVESEGHVQTWTMSNPPMNYMTAAMSQELTELIGRAETDENVRAIILTGGTRGQIHHPLQRRRTRGGRRGPRASARALFQRWKRDFIGCSIASC